MTPIYFFLTSSMFWGLYDLKLGDFFSMPTGKWEFLPSVAMLNMFLLFNCLVVNDDMLIDSILSKFERITIKGKKVMPVLVITLGIKSLKFGWFSIFKHFTMHAELIITFRDLKLQLCPLKPILITCMRHRISKDRLPLPWMTTTDMIEWPIQCMPWQARIENQFTP